jgi:hypothetical protein
MRLAAETEFATKNRANAIATNTLKESLATVINFCYSLG